MPTRSEPGSAAEPELLHPIVVLLHERESVVEPQRSERRIPDQAHTNGGPDRLGIKRTDGLARHVPARWPLVVPKRTGIGEDRTLDAGILGQEIERRLRFDAGAPIHRSAQRIL